MRPLTGDPSADAYLVLLAGRADEILGEGLVGSYLVNSGARGDYLPCRSDLDVALIVDDALPDPMKRRLATELAHAALPCPAPRLELVAYRRGVAAAPGERPPFELNLNSGPATPDHVALDPAHEPWFWFALDLAAAVQAAISITGPPPAEIFGDVPHRAVVDALLASLAWHAGSDSQASNRVLNACRAWCWIATARWPSKTEAATWAIEAGEDADLIRHAMGLRAGEREDPLPIAGVDRLGDRVRGQIEAA
jgi:hypothetical protein